MPLLKKTVTGVRSRCARGTCPEFNEHVKPPNCALQLRRTIGIGPHTHLYVILIKLRNLIEECRAKVTNPSSGHQKATVWGKLWITVIGGNENNGTLRHAALGHRMGLPCLEQTSHVPRVTV